MNGMPPATAVRRELLERVLLAVRELGGSRDLNQTLQAVVRDAVEVLGFAAAAVSVAGPGRLFELKAVAGVPDARDALGTTATGEDWERLLAGCDEQGDLRFLSRHDAELNAGDRPATLVASAANRSWQAADSLFAPLYGWDRTLLGVLCVDQQIGAPLPDLEQRTALELFAGQAAVAIEESIAYHRLDRRRREAEQRWRVAFENGLVSTGVLDSSGMIVEVNDASAQTLGFDRTHMVGRNCLDMVHLDDRAAALATFEEFSSGQRRQVVSERLLLHRDGRPVWTIVHGATVKENGEVFVILQWIDITDRKHAEQRLTHQVTHDALTDLPNRRTLETALKSCIDRRDRPAVLFCDLDGFKHISDNLGHEAGDAMLREVARRLRASLPPDAVLARLEGDEFVAVLAGASADDDVAAAGEALLLTLHEPVTARGHELIVRMSVGASVVRAWHERPGDVLREADQALLRAKRRGGNRLEIFDPAQDRPVTVDDLELERSLRAALNNGRDLVPHFQTVISLMSGETVGYESLLRWQHPARGLLLADQFLPLAERTGLMAPIGWRALRLTADALPGIDGFLQDTSWIAVNVSAPQLGRGELVAELRRLSTSCPGMTPERLRLEITERSLIDADPTLVDELYAVVDLGVGITLDDFGTGYSSLTLLRDLPVSAVKIDRSFVTPIAMDIRARTIVQHAIELCRGLGMTTIAEGIETHEQLGWLQTLGCDFGQGYLIDTPSPRGRVSDLGLG